MIGNMDRMNQKSLKYHTVLSKNQTDKTIFSYFVVFYGFEFFIGKLALSLRRLLAASLREGFVKNLNLEDI